MRVCSRFDESRRLLISSGWIWVMAIYALAATGATAQPSNSIYSIEVQPGYNSIANHLNRDGNRLDAVIPDPPDGSELWKFNPTTQGYYTPAQFIAGYGWMSQEPDMEFLKPGEGAFLYVTRSTTLTFSGELAQVSLPRQAVMGYNFVSAHQPRTMSFGELFGFPPLPGDMVYLYDYPFTPRPELIQQNASSTHKFTAQGWDIIPSFKRGRSAFVYLGDGLRIVTHPASRIASAGQTVRFDVSVIGAGPLQYQWLFNEDDLPGENNSFLSISNVQFWHSGPYSVVVSNPSGAATSRQALLRVNSRPVILEPPQAVQTTPGEKVVFQVRATGTPNLRYQWFRDNQPLPDGTEPMLVIDSAQQPAQYFVRVSNDLGFAQSQPVPLTIVFPPLITTHPISQTVRPGDTVTFKVDAQGTQPLTYHWRRNGQRIPWGTDSILVVSNVQPSDAGAYDVVVANVAGATRSEPAFLRVELPFIFLSDSFAGSELFTEPMIFTGRGDNLHASNEVNEVHCEVVGGSSVWLRWMTKDPGIVTFDTSGSSFDTVIAAYRNDPGAPLMPVACDDDEGEYFGSRMQFVAFPDVVYHIAIDGLDGKRGEIVLHWNFEPTPEILPLIARQPEDQTARRGEKVVFSVVVNGDPTGYQWFHNGAPLFGQTRPDLVIDAVDFKDLGSYRVRIFHENRFVDSRRASLQMSLSGVEDNLLRAFTFDKFADAVDRRAIQPPRMAMPAAIQEINATASSIVFGYTGTQIFSTFASTGEEGELSHCGIPGGASQWFTYQAPANGQLHLNTAGSSFDTVLAVYTGPGPLLSSLTPLICDNNSGPGSTSSLNFPASGGTIYYIAVDGVSAATGLAYLNYRLLVPMTLTQIVKTNDTLCQFRVTATPSYPFTIQRCVGFSSWVNVLTTNKASGIFDFRDTNATVQKRFYRALQTP